MDKDVKFDTENFDKKVISYKDMQAMTVEELADLLKFGDLPEYKYDAVANLLTRKLSGKAHQGWATQDQEGDKTFEELFGSDGYCGEITTKTFNFALEAYGKLDAKTGKRIPFEKLYWSCFGLKNRDCTTNFLNNTKGEEQKAKKEELNQLVKGIAQKNNRKDQVKRFNPLNKDSLEEALKNAGADDQENATALRILENSPILRDLCFDETGEESGSYLSDAVSVTNFQDAEAALETIVGATDIALSLAKNDKERSSILCITTLKIRDYVASGNYACSQDLQRLVDPKLLRFVNGRTEEDKVLLMEYLGVQDRELRRRMARANELLLCGLESLSAA